MPVPVIIHTSDRSLRITLPPSPRRSPEETRARIRALAEAFAKERQAWIVDIVPSADALLIVHDPRTSPRDALISAAAIAREPAPAKPTRPASHTVPACYHPSLAPDLEPLAAELGLTIDRLTELHASATYAVDCLGFQPGFAYLTGLPAELHAPRLSTPRPRVPAGSVGIAGDRTGVYPHATPGGWRLIARTAMTLFNPAATPPTPPATLAAGDTVRFRPISVDEFQRARDTA